MSAYGNITQLSAGNLFGAQIGALTGSFVAEETIKFGMCAFGYRGNPDSAINIHVDKAVITYSADFTAANALTINVTVNGLVMEELAYATSHAVTIAAVVVAIQALDPTWEVSVTGRVITIVTPGETASASTVVTGATPPTGAVVLSTSTNMIVLGPVLKAQKAPTSVADSDVGYTQGEALEVLMDGQMTVVVDAIANVSFGLPVYVITTGANAGKFTGTVGSNLLLNGVFEGVADAAQNLAVIRIDNMKKLVS